MRLAMNLHAEPDLMPPPFAEGLDDWSRGDGTPEGPTWDKAVHARIARDPDFGVCLEVRKVSPVERLRYMGELPVRSGAYLEIEVRIKVLRGALPLARIAAWPGGALGREVAGLPQRAPEVEIGGYDAPVTLAAVIGPKPCAGVELVWDARALYAHVGLDLVGTSGGVVRIAAVTVRDVTRRFAPLARPLPGFEDI
jgi:hypothetical protein